jgi:hypothetical protein
MLAHTKDMGAGGFRAWPAEGALAATGGVSPSPRWDGLLGRIGGRRAPRPNIKVRQQLPGRARYVVVVGATRTGSAGAARRARHCPKAIRAHGACRRPGTTPSQRSSRASSAPCSLINTTNGPNQPRLRRARQIPQQPTPTIRTGGPPGGTDRLNHPHRRITRQRRTPRPWT